MTNLRKRLGNVLAELAIIREALAIPSQYPSCCLTISKDGMISCDFLGALAEKEFLKECQKCRAEVEKILANFNLDAIEKIKIGSKEPHFYFKREKYK